MNVGEVAAAAGVSVRTLHHRDAVGLLVPSKCLNGDRDYGPADRIAQLQDVAALVHRAVEAKSMGMDERFTAHYERVAPGLAQYVHDGVRESAAAR